MTASESVRPFDPATTFVHLDGGKAEVMAVDDQFWPKVMSGQRPLPGWLMTASSWSADPGVGGGGNRRGNATGGGGPALGGRGRGQG
ncbi:MAG: hypothetical protein ACR2MN_09135, partial [Acidimicrobiales bacterium]